MRQASECGRSPITWRCLRSPMWLPGSCTFPTLCPSLCCPSFPGVVLSLWEPDASHLLQCQMKSNICTSQGLWLAINKLANKDLVCWGGLCGLAGKWGRVRVGAGGVRAALWTFFFNQTFNCKWLSTPEQPAGLSTASKLY